MEKLFYNIDNFKDDFLKLYDDEIQEVELKLISIKLVERSPARWNKK